MECRAKVVVLGACGSGKSSLIKKFISGGFDPNHPTTIGALYHTKEVHRKQELVHLDIWDTAGQERYGAIAPMYYRDAHTVVVLYDVTDKESINIARKWCQEVRERNTQALMIVFGNKTDLIHTTQSPKSISAHSLLSESALFRIQQVFEGFNAVHMCGSAKTGEGVNVLFRTISNKTTYQEIVAPESTSWWCW
ncbi:Ras-related protein Rab-5C [Nematocida sp. AWRm80]|nr:Ras-related protein Rab-5C [Nematocida sp. AWRm80]